MPVEKKKMVVSHTQKSDSFILTLQQGKQGDLGYSHEKSSQLIKVEETKLENERVERSNESQSNKKELIRRSSLKKLTFELKDKIFNVHEIVWNFSPSTSKEIIASNYPSILNGLNYVKRNLKEPSLEFLQKKGLKLKPFKS